MNRRAAPYVLAAGEARSHPDSFQTIKAGAADTAGLLTFCDEVLGPRTAGPALHVHDDTDECLYVIDGHLLVQAGEERHALGVRPAAGKRLLKERPGDLFSPWSKRIHAAPARQVREGVHRRSAPSEDVLSSITSHHRALPACSAA